MVLSVVDPSKRLLLLCVRGLEILSNRVRDSQKGHWSFLNDRPCCRPSLSRRLRARKKAKHGLA